MDQRIDVAIIGRGCVLPGALSVAVFGERIFAGDDLVSEVPAGRFGVDPALVTGTGVDRTPTTAGGYVQGFEEIWQPGGLCVDPAELDGLDPLFHWLLHCGRAALAEAGIGPGDARLARCGAIFGNLSFPTEGMSRWGEALLLAESGRPGGAADPRNHMMSGLPAEILRRGLGLGGESFALDAACASALYAIALAADALSAGRIDLALAGAVNRADPLFLHIGFHALGAISATGQSRPFCAGADGLLPAEGCALLVLKRLADAERDGDRVLGVIRGVGLSNDGRARNLLAPSVEGQARAMRLALARAEIPASRVRYVECHATGTKTGDGTEISSMREVYAGPRPPGQPMAIGSLKSNTGHLITVAGAAGLLKVLEGFARGQLPPMRVAAPLIDTAPFAPVGRPQPWDGDRIAAVSAFGFGGNNAHLIVAAPDVPARAQRQPADDGGRSRLSVIAAGARRGGEGFTLKLERLRFPPNDLRQALAQQSWLLQAARDLCDGLELPPRERVGVFVGMGCDGAVSGWGLRWRMPALVEGEPAGGLRDQAAPGLRAEHVVGTMPNIPANRISVQMDAAGPGFTVSAEELSGLRALEVAADRLHSGDIDLAIVGAVDLATEPRLRSARLQLGAGAHMGDGVAVLVLARSGGSGGTIHCRSTAFPLYTPEDGRCFHAAEGLIRVVDALRAGLPRTVQIRGFGGSASVGVEPSVEPPAEPEPAQEGMQIQLHGFCERLSPARLAHLAPAPALPPVLYAGSPCGPEAAPEIAHAPPAPAGSGAADDDPPDTSIEHATEPVVAEQNDPLSLLQQQNVDIASVHRQFLEGLSASQQRFLSAWASADRLMAAVAGGTVIEAEPMAAPVFAAVAPVAPVAPAVAAVAPVVAPVAPAVAHVAPVVAPVTPAVAHVAPAVAPVAPVAPAVAPAVAPVAPAVAVKPAKGGAGHAVPAWPDSFPGPKLSRVELERLSSEPVSTVLGAGWGPLDAWAKVIRMPEPPLLLADRVLGIDGPALVQGRGTIWTQTDVKADAWYLEDGRMPGGVLIESGQADLLLGSWQGIDLACQGERIYRLLGCHLIYRRPLPKPGETLSYNIHIDGHAKLGGIRMFFFHYDCRVDAGGAGEALQIQVREGQAGFFTEAELADSGGVLWTPEEHALDAALPVEPGPVVTQKRSFSRKDLDALAEGRQSEAFGRAFYRADPHTHSPRMGKNRLMDRVVSFEPEGGPWGRGYLRAELDISPDLWFFNGHFKNDPCMPGTLMFDGCLQALQLYLLATGHGTERDGWRFEPAQDQVYKLICRGQVIPTSRKLTYEIFVEGMWAGPVPKIRAQVLCTVDGLKCFHADPLMVELVPDWPMSRMSVLDNHREPKPCVWDYRSLLACAWGQPSHAFGRLYAPYDGPLRCPRLPGPPYLFITRVTKTEGEMGAFQADCAVEVEYEAPAWEWYFQEGHGVMPYAVLLEAVLQPCGWLASWVGSSLQFPGEMLFRNLDGKGKVYEDVYPGELLKTRVVITGISRSGGMIIENFRVRMVKVLADGQTRPVYDLDTVFGFFPPAAFAKQVGLPPTPEERAAFEQPSDLHVNLLERPAPFFGGRYADGAPAPSIAPGFLLMIDRLTGYWPQGGAKGLGRWRAEKDIRPGDWYLRAHFYSDPVQPGSLGIEAMIQTLQAHMIHKGYGRGMKRPRFEPIATELPIVWRYRGQVVPHDKIVGVDLEITAETETVAVADVWLWVDGRRIYKAEGLAVRVVDDPVAPPSGPYWTTVGSRRIGLGRDGLPDEYARRQLYGAPPPAPIHASALTVPVPVDHAPTWVLPSLPMMSMAMIALSHSGAPALREAVAQRWLTFPDGPRTIQIQDHPAPDHAPEGGARVVLAAEGRPFFTALPGELQDPPALNPLIDADEGCTGEALYASGALFHGPRFHAVAQLVARASNGASVLLKAGLAPDVLLDGATHGVPHDNLQLWFPELPAGMAAYPLRIRQLGFFGPPPAGQVRCELRALGYSQARMPVIGAWLLSPEDSELLCYLEWEEVQLPKGRIGAAPPEARRAFLTGTYVPGLSLSRIDASGFDRGDRMASLAQADADSSDWLPGTVERVFGTRSAAQIAGRELLAALLSKHPRLLASTPEEVWDPQEPLRRWRLWSDEDIHHIQPGADCDLGPVLGWWRRQLGRDPDQGGWPAERVAAALIRTWLGGLHIDDPAGLAALQGRPVLYLGNHETYLESVMFTILVSALTGARVEALAKEEHRSGWLGRLHDLLTRYPGVAHPGSIVYFNQQEPASLPLLLQDRLRTTGLLCHVEGVRQVTPGQPIGQISSLWVDLAIERGIPIVPVAFRGGIGDGQKHDIPQDSSAQHIFLGAAIQPETLAALPYAERRRRVAAAIDQAGPVMPAVPRLEVEAAVQRWTPSLGRPLAAVRAALEMDAAEIGREDCAGGWGEGLLY